MVVPTLLNLDQYETRELLALESRASSLYTAKMMIRGNSLLSSVFVKSITAGATLKINYYDTTTGTDSSPERFDLNSHNLITAADVGKTFRILVTRIHNKPQVEAIVTGGTVEFGVYISVVSDFPVDIRGAILDEQLANLPLDGGLPVSVYNPDDGKFYLLRGSDAGLFIAPSVSTPLNHTLTVIAANIEQSFTFPAGTRRFLLRPRGNSKIKLAHVVTQSSTNYLTIFAGQVYQSPEFYPQAKSIYFQSPTAGAVIEAESWT